MKTKNKNELYRAFLAFELPKNIIDLSIKIKNKLIDNGLIAKWTEENNLHITAEFFGNISKDKIKQLSKNIERANINLKEIRFLITGIITFGKPAKVIAIKLEDIGGINIHQVTKKLKIESNKKSYIPHITLGRVKKIQENNILKKEFIKLKGKNFSPLSLTLFRSILTPKGPIYQQLYRKE